MVAASTTFGRKRTSGVTAGVTAPISPAARQGLSPQAEAFRASLRANPDAPVEDFANWRRTTQPRRWVAWAVGLALMSPGLLCFALHTPRSVSVGLEVAGAVANAWLRQERRRHLREIATWTPPTEN